MAENGRGVRRLAARMKGGNETHPGLQARMKLLLIQRARLVKSARGKVAAAVACYMPIIGLASGGSSIATTRYSWGK